MNSRVEELIAGFDAYIDAFDRANLFTGLSMYFHVKTVALLRRHGSAANALQNDEFLEYVYATLTAWGMHRMGRNNTKLADFQDFTRSFRAHVPGRVLKKGGCRGAEPSCRGSGGVPQIQFLLWGRGAGGQHFVFQHPAKALHHVLPDLVMPVDRQYTLRFFGYHAAKPGRAEFVEIFRQSHAVAVGCRKPIEAKLGSGMHTSITKVIDNAIVGFVLENLKR